MDPLPDALRPELRPNAAKLLVKRLAGAALTGLGAFPRLLGDRGVVVAFHRIDDRYPGNPITYGVEGFRSFCRFFGREFDVVPLRAFLDDLDAGHSIAGKLAITFDDGYLDNATTAAPILHDLRLPATFFVTTGFIGTRRVPWWDEAAGIQSEWMAWEDVQELDRLGFDIGAHTVNHVDLGRVRGAEARSEILDSKRTLEDRLGRRVDLFAFPFGRETNLLDENRALIQELGFRCAPSCEGGTVRPGRDPYRMPRIPISPWYRSTQQFAWEVLRD